MLNQAEQEELARQLVATAEVMGDEARPNVVALMVRELTAHPLAALDKALATCRRELKGRLSLASILERIDDGHPAPNEAWAIALPAADERNTVIWTAEIQSAWAACLPLVQAGDKIAGRLAFIEAYTRQLKEARAQSRRGVFQPSMGFDLDGRSAAIEHAQHTNAAAEQGITPCLWRSQYHLPIAVEQQAHCQKVEQQKALYAAGHMEHLPFVPVGGIYLVNDQRQQRSGVPAIHRQRTPWWGASLVNYLHDYVRLRCRINLNTSGEA